MQREIRNSSKNYKTTSVKKFLVALADLPLVERFGDRPHLMQIIQEPTAKANAIRDTQKSANTFSQYSICCVSASSGGGGGDILLQLAVTKRPRL